MLFASFFALPPPSAPETSSTISSGVFASRRDAVNDFFMSERARVESSFRCAWSAPSGAAMKKIKSAGPSFAPKSTAGLGRAMARVGTVTAAERQCGMAIPPGMPVSVLDSRAFASAYSWSKSLARSAFTMVWANRSMTSKRESPRFSSSRTSSGAMSSDMSTTLLGGMCVVRRVGGCVGFAPAGCCLIYRVKTLRILLLEYADVWVYLH